MRFKFRWGLAALPILLLLASCATSPVAPLDQPGWPFLSWETNLPPLISTNPPPQPVPPVYTPIKSKLSSAGPATTISLSWDACPPAAEVTSYNLYSSPTVAGPYVMLTNVTTNFVRLAVTQGQCFYFVTASNFWTESLPSNTVHTPAVADPVTTRISKP